MKREATAVWNGSGKEGKGHLSTKSNTLNKTPYSWSSRFAEGAGTNPEELIAAAHAGCFTMKLSFLIGEAGFTPESIETSSNITFEGDALTNSHLVVKAKVPGMSKDAFLKAAEDSKVNCPVSKALHTNITMEAVLQGEGMR